jgi:DNA invertase Pin-like site-specific DNA recombinase
LTGINRDRPGFREALAACREGDTLVVTKLDRLARSLPDARDIVDDLTRRRVRLSLNGSLHDPNDPVDRLLFNVLAMVAEFEADLILLRTREGMRVAKAKGRLRGKQPKLHPRQEAHLVVLHAAGDHSIAELGDLFGVARTTVYRAIQRATGDASRRSTRTTRPRLPCFDSRSPTETPSGPRGGSMRTSAGVDQRRRPRLRPVIPVRLRVADEVARARAEAAQGVAARGSTTSLPVASFAAIRRCASIVCSSA